MFQNPICPPSMWVIGKWWQGHRGGTRAFPDRTFVVQRWLLWVLTSAVPAADIISGFYGCPAQPWEAGVSHDVSPLTTSLLYRRWAPSPLSLLCSGVKVWCYIYAVRVSLGLSTLWTFNKWKATSLIQELGKGTLDVDCIGAHPYTWDRSGNFQPQMEALNNCPHLFTRPVQSS